VWLRRPRACNISNSRIDRHVRGQDGLSAAFDAGFKKLQETSPRINAGLGVSLRRATHTEQTIGHSFNLQPHRARGSRPARYEDEVPRALVFQMSGRIGVTMRLKPTHCDVGERRRWPHLIVSPRYKQNRSPRLLHRDRRPQEGTSGLVGLHKKIGEFVRCGGARSLDAHALCEAGPIQCRDCRGPSCRARRVPHWRRHLPHGVRELRVQKGQSG
jgi:hypothetical protein